MEMRVLFPGGRKVGALYKGFTVQTDQPVEAGGENSAPSPFDLFLCSIGTCAGYYVLDFCQERSIPYQEIELTVNFEKNRETGMVANIGIEIWLPPGFPEQYREAIVRVAGLCAVKKHLADPPEFQIRAVPK